MRFVLPILACLLAVAAGLRFHAEAETREARAQLRAARAAVEAERAEEARLRLEVEVLESAARFEEVNARTLRLETPEPGQLSTRDAFAERIGREGAAPKPTGDAIAAAIKLSAPDAAGPASPAGEAP